MSTPKSAPVLLPNAKKPSLLMRLFSTERKSSIYVMPTNAGQLDPDGHATAAGGGETAQQHKRQMQRLKSVDSATMERDRDAMRQQQRHQPNGGRHSHQPQQQREHKRVQATPSAPPVETARYSSSSSSSSLTPPASPQKQQSPTTPPTPLPETSSATEDHRHAVAQQQKPARPTSAATTSGTTSNSASSPVAAAVTRKQSMPHDLKIHQPMTSTADKAMGSPTGNDRSPPLQPSSPAVDAASSSSGHRKHSLTAKHKSSPETEMAPTALTAVGGVAKLEVTSATKKRPSISAELAAAPSGGGDRQQRRQRKGSRARKLKHRKQKAPQSGDIKVDVTKPLEFPTTPDIISEYHRQKPFLNHNEEWLIVELLEYECLIDGLEIIKIIAKHSKFFELEPDELWEEFFEFVENVPSYDEIINYDVWQEFLLEKYNC